jgi:RND superfamily putative drug exporter
VHVVHLHGGAYVYSAQEAHWRALARLAGASGAIIHAPLYSLAPGSTVDDALPLLDAVISTVRQAEEGSRVFLSGDSAGGGLALAQALRMRDLRHRPVDGILLFSPWVDVALDNPEIGRLERRDPMLSRRMLVQSGRWWAGERDTSDPLVSPLRADLTGLPRVTTYIGGRDILLADARELDRRIRAAGGESTLREWASGFHVFMAALSTKEARAVIADAANLLRASAVPA